MAGAACTRAIDDLGDACHRAGLRVEPTVSDDDVPLDLSLGRVRQLLHLLFIGESDVGERERKLRREDEQKARELAALLPEIARILPSGRKRALTIVDAACGKSALGLLTAALIVAPRQQRASIVTLDRSERFIARAATAAAQMQSRALIDERVMFACRVGDARDASLWPEAPELVLALHACGRASDDIIDVSMETRARALLVVPCCYGAHPDKRFDDARAPPGQKAAHRHAQGVGLSSHGVVGRRFASALIELERTLRLEAQGYECVTSEVFSNEVSPYNLLYRARRVCEPARMAHHAALHARLVDGGGV
jgi:hypothetical protein